MVLWLSPAPIRLSEDPDRGENSTWFYGGWSLQPAVRLQLGVQLEKRTPAYFDSFQLSFTAVHFKLDDRHVAWEVCILPKEKSIDVTKDLVTDCRTNIDQRSPIVFKSEILKVRRNLPDAPGLATSLVFESSTLFLSVRLILERLQ